MLNTMLQPVMQHPWKNVSSPIASWALSIAHPIWSLKIHLMWFDSWPFLSNGDSLFVFVHCLTKMIHLISWHKSTDAARFPRYTLIMSFNYMVPCFRLWFDFHWPFLVILMKMKQKLSSCVPFLTDRWSKLNIWANPLNSTSTISIGITCGIISSLTESSYHMERCKGNVELFQ